MTDLSELTRNHPVSALAMGSLIRLDGETDSEPLLDLAILGMETEPAARSECLEHAIQVRTWELAEQALMMAEDYESARSRLDEGEKPEKVLKDVLDDLESVLSPMSDLERQGLRIKPCLNSRSPGGFLRESSYRGRRSASCRRCFACWGAA